jgi:hypothetical protein
MKPGGGDEAFPVPPFAGVLGVVAGPDVAGHGLEQLETLADRVEQGILDGLRFAVQRRGLDLLTRLTSLARGHAQAGVQHRYRLGGAAGHVVVGPGDSRALGPDPGPLSVDLARGRERMLIAVPRYRERLGRRLVLIAFDGGVFDDPLSVRAYAFLVEPLGHLGLNRARDAERGRPAAFPGAWGFAGAGVVGHGTGASGGVAAGDVGDVVAGFDVGFNGHGGSPRGYGARWGGRGHRVMHRYKRFGLRTRTHACCYCRTWLRSPAGRLS